MTVKVVPAASTLPKKTREICAAAVPGAVIRLELTVTAAPPALSSEPDCTVVAPVLSPPGAAMTRTSSSSPVPVIVGSLSSFGAAVVVPSTATRWP